METIPTDRAKSMADFMYILSPAHPMGVRLSIYACDCPLVAPEPIRFYKESGWLKTY